MGVSSFKSLHWALKDASFSAIVHIGCSRSFKVDDFGTNRKRTCDFQSVILGHIVRRFWDTATYWLKIAYFSYPSVIRRPHSISSLWNFAVKLTTRKLESCGYSVFSNKWCWWGWKLHDPITSTFFDWFTRVTGGRTDVPSRTIAYSVFCIMPSLAKNCICGSAAWEAYDAPPNPTVGWGGDIPSFFPSPQCLWRLASRSPC